LQTNNQQNPLSIEQAAFSSILSNSPQQPQLITTQSLEEVSNKPQMLINEDDLFIDDDNDDYIEQAEVSSIHLNLPPPKEISEADYFEKIENFLMHMEETLEDGAIDSKKFIEIILKTS
jgi:hypothetical protein